MKEWENAFQEAAIFCVRDVSVGNDIGKENEGTLNNREAKLEKSEDTKEE